MNEFPNVSRKFVRDIEGAIHAWDRHGYESAKQRFIEKYRYSKGIELSNVLRGRIAFLKMVRGEEDFIYRRLARKFNHLSPKPIRVPSLSQALPCSLHGIPRAWNDVITSVRDNVIHLIAKDEHGDEFSGSAFHLGGGLIATARHNLYTDRGCAHSGVELKIDDQRRVVDVVNRDIDFNAPDVALIRIDSRINNADRILTQLRLPMVGEEVAAIGFPTIPLRDKTLVVHVGTVESLPVCYQNQLRFIQVSFQSGGGLSGGCLLDRSGHVIGIMTENVFLGGGTGVPSRPYGQAVPMEYVDDLVLADQISGALRESADIEENA